MQPSQSELEFYQDRCPALIDSGWEWSDHQSFLSSMAIRKLEDISYRGKLVCVSVHYHNNGTQSRFFGYKLETWSTHLLSTMIGLV
jgi:hypothetical protein